MKKIIQLLAVIYGLMHSSVSYSANHDVYSKSYFGRQMPEETFVLYRGVLRQIYRLERDIDNARVHAEAFFDYLATAEQPDFSTHAGGDVNVDPVGVLWSQLELAMQGKEYNLRVPDDFRKIALAMRVWNGRPDSEFIPEMRYQLYYEAYRRLSPSAFLVDSAQKRTYDMFFNNFFSTLNYHIEAGDPWAKSFLSDWVQARIEISRIDWDPHLQEALISKHNLHDDNIPWFPVIMRFNSILPGLLDALEDGYADQYAWLINGLLDRFQAVGSLIGTALFLCDPHGDATPSSSSMELANQGRWREIFIQDPFPWIGVADYLLRSTEIQMTPPILEDGELIFGTHQIGDAEPSASDTPQRRTVAGLHELGFPVERVLSRMTEQERASFCATWPGRSKEVLAQFRYMMHLIIIMQSKNPIMISDLWQARIHDAKAFLP